VLQFDIPDTFWKVLQKTLFRIVLTTLADYRLRFTNTHFVEIKSFKIIYIYKVSYYSILVYITI
jgi:hypothetical protein